MKTKARTSQDAGAYLDGDDRSDDDQDDGPWEDNQDNVAQDDDDQDDDNQDGHDHDNKDDDAGIMIDFLPIEKPEDLDDVLAASFDDCDSPATPLSDGDSGISNASEESTVRGPNGALSTVLRLVIPSIVGSSMRLY